MFAIPNSLLVLYPRGLTLDELAERIEIDAYMIAETEDAEFLGVDQYWMFRIKSKRAHDEIAKMSKEKRDRLVAKAWEERGRRWKDYRGE